jgi:hypothetical protein
MWFKSIVKNPEGDEASRKEIKNLGEYVWRNRKLKIQQLEAALKASQEKVKHLERSLSNEIAFNAKLIKQMETKK